MKTTTHVKCLIQVGPFGTEETIRVPNRSEETIAAIKEKFGESLLALMVFDVLETEIDDIRFISEPTNVKIIEVVPAKEIEERIQNSARGLVRAIWEIVSSHDDSDDDFSQGPGTSTLQ